MAFDRTDLRFLYYTENSHEYKSSKDLSNHHFIFITPIRILLITNRKRRSLTPYSKLRRAYTVNIASRADSGQWLVHERQILLSPERAWNKEGVVWSQKWLPYHLPKGYSGVSGVRGQRQNESNRTPGNSPRVNAERERTSISHMHLTWTYNSLYLSLNSFSLRPFFVLQIKPSIAHISFFLFLLYNAQIFRYFFFYLRI
jgi:hypothetical protein